MRRRIVGLFALVVLWSDVQLPASDPDFRLIDAAKQRDSRAVASLLKQGVPVDTSQPDGATALHWAAHWDDAATAQLLIAAQAKVDAVNDYGVTPLVLACTNGSLAMVERLLTAGADPNRALPTGETPLMTAARSGDAAVVTALIDRGAAVNAAEGTKGQTPLMWAAAERHLDVARTLVQHGADVSARSKGGFTALLFAVRENDFELVRLLLASGADVNETASDGSAPLVMATVLGHLQLAEFLLDRGANPNAMAAGFTPLHYASGAWETVMTAQYQHTALGEHLFGLPKHRKAAFVKMLLARGADPNLKITREPPRHGGGLLPRGLLIGGTPFFFAAMAGDVEVMRILAAAGADPKEPTRGGVTALMAAAGLMRQDGETVVPDSDYVEAVKLAIEFGVPVNALTNDRDTALHAVAFSGLNGAVQPLVKAGADLHSRNSHGHTPFEVAEGGRCCSQVPMQIYKKPQTAALLREVGGAAQ